METTRYYQILLVIIACGLLRLAFLWEGFGADVTTPDTRTATLPLDAAERRHLGKSAKGLNTTSKDKWWMDFLPYMKGIYKPNFTCVSDCEGFTKHLDAKNKKTKPNFSCSSSIPALSKSERANMTRPQLTIRCEDGKAVGVMETVSLDSPIQVMYHLEDVTYLADPS